MQTSAPKTIWMARKVENHIKFEVEIWFLHCGCSFLFMCIEPMKYIINFKICCVWSNTFAAQCTEQFCWHFRADWWHLSVCLTFCIWLSMTICWNTQPKSTNRTFQGFTAKDLCTRYFTLLLSWFLCPKHWALVCKIDQKNRNDNSKCNLFYFPLSMISLSSFEQFFFCIVVFVRANGLNALRNNNSTSTSNETIF